MKCNELTPVTREYADEYWEDRFAMVYNADEVDAAIAELKAKLYEAEEARIEAGADAADYYQENRKLKRALWMARKAHAVAMFAYWDSHYRDNPNAVYRNRTIDWLRNRWLLILDSIIEKEKEYK